jgi:outer membrane protein OmpA-like peptidoglycan-associated protein
MRIVPFLIGIVLAVPAAAQSDSVIVGGDGSGQTLIDPATGQTRFVPSLLQPWQDQTIRLKPPGRHRVRKPATPAATATPSAEPEIAAAPPPPKKKRVATVTQPPVQTPKPAAPKPAAPPPKSSISGFADIDLITGTGQQTQQPQAAPPPKAAASAPKAVTSTPKPTRTASIEKPKAKTPTGSRKDSITFTAGASEPSGSAVASVRSLATSLSGAMGDSGRVQLMAYAGAKGEKTSDTRRLSLKRALVVRQLLIDDGIPSERIDVFALGGADDDGALDRVDVYVKS